MSCSPAAGRTVHFAHAAVCFAADHDEVCVSSLAQMEPLVGRRASPPRVPRLEHRAARRSVRAAAARRVHLPLRTAARIRSAAGVAAVRAHVRCASHPH